MERLKIPRVEDSPRIKAWIIVEILAGVLTLVVAWGLVLGAKSTFGIIWVLVGSLLFVIGVGRAIDQWFISPGREGKLADVEESDAAQSVMTAYEAGGQVLELIFSLAEGAANLGQKISEAIMKPERAYGSERQARSREALREAVQTHLAPDEELVSAAGMSIRPHGLGRVGFWAFGIVTLGIGFIVLLPGVLRSRTVVLTDQRIFWCRGLGGTKGKPVGPIENEFPRSETTVLEWWRGFNIDRMTLVLRLGMGSSSARLHFPTSWWPEGIEIHDALVRAPAPAVVAQRAAGRLVTGVPKAPVVPPLIDGGAKPPPPRKPEAPPTTGDGDSDGEEGWWTRTRVTIAAALGLLTIAIPLTIVLASGGSASDSNSSASPSGNGPAPTPPSPAGPLVGLTNTQTELARLMPEGWWRSCAHDKSLEDTAIDGIQCKIPNLKWAYMDVFTSAEKMNDVYRAYAGYLPYTGKSCLEDWHQDSYWTQHGERVGALACHTTKGIEQIVWTIPERRVVGWVEGPQNSQQQVLRAWQATGY